MKCRICQSERRQALEQALSRGLPIRAAASQFGFSRSSVDRHHRQCIPSEVEALSPGAPQGALRRLYGQVERILKQCERRGDLRGALEAVGRLHEISRQLVDGKTGKVREVHIVVRESEGRIRNPGALHSFKVTLKRLIQSTDSADGLSEAVGVYSAQLLRLIDRAYNTQAIRDALALAEKELPHEFSGTDIRAEADSGTERS